MSGLERPVVVSRNNVSLAKLNLGQDELARPSSRFWLCSSHVALTRFALQTATVLNGIFVGLLRSGLAVCTSKTLQSVVRHHCAGLSAFEVDTISVKVARLLHRLRAIAHRGPPSPEEASSGDDDDSLVSQDTEETIQPTSIPLLPEGGGVAVRVGPPAMPLLIMLYEQLGVVYAEQAYVETMRWASHTSGSVPPPSCFMPCSLLEDGKVSQAKRVRMATPGPEATML
jgi:hypothetical protein